ncbi:hypothetical protein V6N11_025909 [Hibiscus sabdariffa]|uniref:Retrotransposon gag domain-containing protein n=1 Tax=Hibiscus sabdariffa TaxID=183260 RepID=A0ABR2SV03_9ROSI
MLDPPMVSVNSLREGALFPVDSCATVDSRPTCLQMLGLDSPSTHSSVLPKGSNSSGAAGSPPQPDGDRVSVTNELELSFGPSSPIGLLLGSLGVHIDQINPTQPLEEPAVEERLLVGHNKHPMLTRSKANIHKPKVYFAHLSGDLESEVMATHTDGRCSASHQVDAHNHLEDVQRRDENRPRRLELPVFTGENPYRWLNRAERYFHLNGIGEKDKLEATAICLDSKALNWFQWWEARTPIVTWDIFRVAILQRFTLSQQRNLYEVLLGLQQTKSVAQYREDFELLSAPLKNADEADLIGIFINGLEEEIKAELSLSKLGSLTQIMDHS